MTRWSCLQRTADDFKAGDIPDPVQGRPDPDQDRPGAGPVARPNVNVNPFAFYLSYYRSRDEDRINPDRLRQNSGELESAAKVP